VWLDEQSAARERAAADPDCDPFADPDPRVGTIYLLHFSRPLGHARHYLGWASNLKRRLWVQRRGGPHAAKILQATHAAGIRLTLVATWTGTRDDERRMKRNNDRARACPKCRNRVLKRKAAAGRRRYAARKAAT